MIAPTCLLLLALFATAMAQVTVLSVSPLTQCLTTDGISCGTTLQKTVIVVDIRFGTSIALGGATQLNVALGTIPVGFSANANIQFDLPYFAVIYFMSTHPTAPYGPLAYTCGYKSGVVIGGVGGSSQEYPACFGGVCDGITVDPTNGGFQQPQSSSTGCGSGFSLSATSCGAPSSGGSLSGGLADLPGSPALGSPINLNQVIFGNIKCFALLCGACGFISQARVNINYEEMFWKSPIMEHRVPVSAGGTVAAYTLAVAVTGDDASFFTVSANSLGSQTTNFAVGPFVRASIIAFNSVNGGFAPTIGAGVLVKTLGYTDSPGTSTDAVFSGNPFTVSVAPTAWPNLPWAYILMPHCYGIGGCQNGINPTSYFQRSGDHCSLMPCAYIPEGSRLASGSNSGNNMCYLNGCTTTQGFMKQNAGKENPPHVPNGQSGWLNRYWICGNDLCYEAITDQNTGITVSLAIAGDFINQQITVQPGEFGATQPSDPCVLFQSNAGTATVSVCNTGTLPSQYTVVIDCAGTDYLVSGSGAVTKTVVPGGAACSNFVFGIQPASTASNSQSCTYTLFDAASVEIDGPLSVACTVLETTFVTPPAVTPPGTSTPAPSESCSLFPPDIICLFKKPLSAALIALAVCCCLCCCVICCCCCIKCLPVIIGPLTGAAALSSQKMGIELPEFLHVTLRHAEDMEAKLPELVRAAIFVGRRATHDALEAAALIAEHHVARRVWGDVDEARVVAEAAHWRTVEGAASAGANESEGRSSDGAEGEDIGAGTWRRGRAIGTADTGSGVELELDLELELEGDDEGGGAALSAAGGALRHRAAGVQRG